MFDRIAGVYDLMNTVMTAGLHHRWRSRAVDLARVGPGTRALDVATGTGDLAIELAARGGDVVGSDFSEGMLERARAKAPGLTWEQADALALPYPDDAFDAATVGFGARNFSDLPRGLRRDGARGQAGRAGRDPRDHDAAEAAPVHVLLFVVRSPGAAARPLRRGLHLPPELGEALPGAAAARRRAGRRRAARRSAGSSPRAGSSRSTTGRSRKWRAPRRSPRSSRQGARTSRS